MKLQTLILTGIMALTVNARAISASDYDRYTDDLMPSYIKEFADAVNKGQLSDDIGYKLSTTEVADKCVSMMDGNMMAGDVGRALSNVFVKNASNFNELVDGGTIKTKYCPRYSRMTTKEKSIVWVFLLTAMAHFESSCKTTAAAKGPNGTAYGYFQLHRGFEHKYDGSNGICQKGDAGKPLAASRCTLSMLDKQLANRQGELFSNKSYWDVLRPNGE